MNPLLKKLLEPRHEYLTLDENLIIHEISLGAQRFADNLNNLIAGNDIRLPFPELIGMEETLMYILEGRQVSFELKGIVRSDDPNSPLYLDLYISEYPQEEDSVKELIVLIEDATERMVLQQILTQQNNEVNLLLSSLESSKKYIDRLITSMADALLVTTASGIIKTVNQATQDLFDYPQEELIDQPISLVITDQDFLQRINNLSAADPGEFLKDVEVICQTKSGKKISVAFSCSAIQTDIEGLQNFVYIGRDLTERKRVETDMIQALERERELRKLKSSLMSLASQEFQTPLNVIFSSTDLLQNYSEQLPEEIRIKQYQRLEGVILQMTELLDDVMLLGKAEAGKLEFHPQPLVLRNFCGDLIEKIQLGIGEKHKIIFVYSGPCRNACMDEKILQHILKNLLMNAVKYSPKATPIRFGCYCENGKVNFEIQDEGIGIPNKDLSQLFKSFHRAKNVGNIPGTGLGLAIVQKLVKLHGGTIMVSSEVGVGTTFRVTLPLF